MVKSFNESTRLDPLVHFKDFGDIPGDAALFCCLKLVNSPAFRQKRAASPFSSRYKSFPVQSDDHLYTVLRYVERNAVRAELVQRAEDWRWSSAWRRKYGKPKTKALLSRWPIDHPRQWLRHVNQPLTETEITAVRSSVARGTPFGGKIWQKNSAIRLGITSTLRPRGRPKKQ